MQGMNLAGKGVSEWSQAARLANEWRYQILVPLSRDAGTWVSSHSLSRCSQVSTLCICLLFSGIQEDSPNIFEIDIRYANTMFQGCFQGLFCL